MFTVVNNEDYLIVNKTNCQLNRRILLIDYQFIRFNLQTVQHPLRGII